MKNKNFFLGMLGVAALSLTACSNDLDDPNGGKDNVGAYMTLQLVGPESRTTTRTTPGEQGTEVGTDVQNKISSILVLLCDQDNHTVKAQYTVPESNLVAVPGGVKTKQILTNTGTFDVYVIANPASLTVANDEVLTGKTIDAVTESLMQSAYAADNKFLMFNECNGTDKVAGSAITITDANDFDNPAVCAPINLDRLAAQIRSKAAETVDITEITGTNAFVSAATLEGYKLLNGATKANLQQKWSKATTDMGATFPWDNVLQTPALAEGTNDGGAEYYNHLTDFRTIAISDGGAYTTVKDLYANVTAYEPTAKGSIFCMENHPTTALLGNTTGLVYQFKATVTGSDDKAGEGCFYGYNNQYFASLAALQAAYPAAFDKAEGTDAATKLAAAEAELATAYAAADKQTEISNFRVKYNVKVYTDGIMYYTYFIKDKNYYDSAKEGESTDAKRYYSVMRNTIYDLTVTKLNRIGTDIPGGWTPDVDEPSDPVDPTNVYMIVEAKVNAWVLSSENITLQ